VNEVGILQLHHPDGQTFAFDPGCLALAFAATGPGTGVGPLARFQALRTPADLGGWAAEVLGAPGIRATADDLDLAVRLQAAIWHVADAVVDQRSAAAPDLEALNEIAARPSLVPQVSPAGARSWIPDQGAAAVLSTVARDAIDVLGGPLGARVKRCEGARCLLLFVDISRPGHRRWCSMDRCGNRAKVAAHRRRRKESQP
jgi:predicted RNA-binding Zn ribbon-like protein